MTERRVLVVGAGPVGLVTALGLAQAGIPVVVVEAEPFLTHDLRAGSFHPPTVEMLEPSGLADRLLEMGIKVPRWQIRDRRAGVVAEFDLGLLADETRYPFRLHCEQHKLTRAAYEMLRDVRNVEIRFATSFVGLRQDGDGVIATVGGPDGREELAADWLIGADGGRSAVRKALGVEFEGFTWPERFLVVSTTYDLEPHGYTYNAYVSDPVEWCAIFKMPHDGPPGLWRIAFPTDPEAPEEEVLSDASVQRLLQGFLPREEPYPVAYRGVYRVHQRVAKTFRVGRVLLAGDAAHVNNPLGGMGLNSGIHDALNLMEKLVRVWRGEADDAVLDRYVRQRRQSNIEHVQAMSIRNKQLLEERDPKVREERLDELRRTAADPARAKEHLLRTSMIASLRRAESIE